GPKFPERIPQEVQNLEVRGRDGCVLSRQRCSSGECFVNPLERCPTGHVGSGVRCVCPEKQRHRGAQKRHTRAAAPTIPCPSLVQHNRCTPECSSGSCHSSSPPGSYVGPPRSVRRPGPSQTKAPKWPRARRPRA